MIQQAKAEELQEASQEKKRSEQLRATALAPTPPSAPAPDVRVKLQVWDTAGQERFGRVTNSYYRGCHGVVVVFDLSDRESFDRVDAWFHQVRLQAPETSCKVLVGTKSDLRDGLCHEVGFDEAERKAAFLGMAYVETSA